MSFEMSTTTDFQFPMDMVADGEFSGADFYSKELHGEALSRLGMALPFTPISGVDSVWICGKCGKSKRFKDKVLIFSSHREISFRQPTSHKCGNIVYTKTFEVTVDGSSYYSREPETFQVTTWPKEQTPKAGATMRMEGRWQYDLIRKVKLLSERVTPCDSDTWSWPLADEASRQVKFLLMLPALERGLLQVGALGFGHEWFQGRLGTAVLAHRVERLEAIVKELAERMGSAGHTLAFGRS
jgi:hypothetical protein